MNKFADLKIIPLSRIIKHEQNDPIRTLDLVKKIKRSRIFTNPVLVAKIIDSKNFILLDGANRTQASFDLGYKNILAQVVDYHNPAEVKLFTHTHLLKTNGNKFINQLVGKGLSLEKLDLDSEKSLKDRSSVGWVKKDCREIYFLGNSKSLNETIAILNTVVSSYLGKVKVNRLSEQKGHVYPFPIEIHFHRFTPDEVIKISKENKFIPSGITRHIADHYYLRVNIPVKLLMEDEVIANKKLSNFINNKVKNRNVRCYKDAIYLFDE